MSEAEDHLGAEIVNEFVKSYGFRRDRTTGDWSWSVENAAKAFEENPFWTSLDWMTTAVPPARWGLQAAKLMRGAGAVAKGYQAGKVGFREGMRLLDSAPASSKVGRSFATVTPASRGRGLLEEPKLMDLVSEFGNDTERRGLATVLKRELFLERSSMDRMRNDALRLVDRFQGDRTQLDRLLGMKETDADFGQVWETLDKRGQKAFRAMQTFRDYVHDEGYRWGLLSKETFEKNLETYRPRHYRELMGGQPAAAGARAAGRPSAKAGQTHFMRRKLTEEESFNHPELTRVLDPSMTAGELAHAGFVVANQKYAMLLGRSPLVKDEAGIISAFGDAAGAEAAGWRRLRDLFPGRVGKASARTQRFAKKRDQLYREIGRHNKDRQKFDGIFSAQESRVNAMQLRQGMNLLSRSMGGKATTSTTAPRKLQGVPRARGAQRFADLGEERGRLTEGKLALYNRMERVFSARGQRLQKRLMRVERAHANSTARDAGRGMLKHLPDEMWDSWVDPLAKDAFEGAAEIGELNLFQKLWHGAMGTFKATHTAYNPATHARNFLGNIVFYSFAMGLKGAARAAVSGGPRKGITSWLAKDGDYLDAVKAGIIGSGFDTEIAGHLRRLYGRPATGMSWLSERLAGKGYEKLGKAVERGAGGLERLYGAEDEVWKLDAFSRLKNRYMRRGVPKSEAVARATLDVRRYFPNYQDVSPLTDMMRGALPFASFPMEAARVWKNAMIARPWAALWWNHMAESASTVFGAVTGFEQEDLDAARQSLPWYTQEKKMLVLPWRSPEGKPHFLDLSYIIPMADMGAEAQMWESSFLGVPVPTPISPETNPVFQILAGAVTGVDPFSERPIEPRFTEQQLGVAVPEGMPRRLVGLAEHIARTMLPPMVPPGYVGVNLWELARGTKSGATGQPLEEGLVRTMTTNLMGLRTFEPTVKAQIQNIRRERRLQSEELVHLWDRWEIAVANGDIAQAEQARAGIIEQKGSGWFLKNAKRHVPGRYGNLSKGELAEVIRRSRSFETTPEEIGPVYLRYLQAGGGR